MSARLGSGELSPAAPEAAVKACARVCALLALLVCPLLVLGQTGNLVFLESPDAKGTLDRGQMSACMAQLVRDLGLSGRELPVVMVLHVSDKAGSVAGLVQRTTLRHNTGTSGPPAYYELWIMGAPSPSEYLTAFENILERHFAMNLSDERRAQVLTQLARFFKNTVTVAPQ